MEIKVFKPDNFNSLKEAWMSLENGKDMTAFQQFGWYSVLNSFYDHEKMKNHFRKWIYLLVVDNEKPVMIAPLQIVKTGLFFKGAGLRRGAYLIGRRTHTDYLNFVYKEFSSDAFNMIVDYVKAEYRITFWQFEQLLKSTELYSHIAEKGNEIKEIPNVSVMLPETFDEYNAMLSKSSRQNIRTAINRANKNGVEFSFEYTETVTDEMCDRFLELRKDRIQKKAENDMSSLPFTHRLYLKGVGYLSRFNYKCDVYKENYRPWCLLIKSGEKIVGSFFGVRNNTTLYTMLLSIDEELSWFSPNVSNMYLFIKSLYEDNPTGIKEIDFTKGAEKYKFDLGGAVKPSVDINIVF